jgi:type 1 fimbria pilin
MHAERTPSVVRAAVAALLLAVVPAVAGAQAMAATPEGKDVTITGTVVDVSCKFGQGLTGDQHRMCAQVCADRGIPLAILADDGTLYVPTSAAMPGDNQNGRLKEFAEQRVTVRGKAFPAGGAQALQISAIRRA